MLFEDWDRTNLAVFKLPGKIPCLIVKFILFVTGSNISTAAEDNNKG